ncbi:MAG: alpha-galactosidase, partial [Rikenellaceae bacterium]
MGKLIAIIIILFSLSTSHAQVSKPIAAPMGWNSFCSYGVYLNQDDAIKQIEQLAKRYKKYGYNHFIIDAGWFGEFNMQKGTLIPAERHARDVHINEFGLLQPSNCYFSNGLKVLADLCHRKGLKFGIHIMRGIPRKAYEENCKIYATNYTARDIADTVHTCKWNHQNYGVNMSKHGSQEFYNSLINQIASWGVDFLKVDDIVAYPKEIKAIVDAINQCGREITLSLSPGDNV